MRDRQTVQPRERAGILWVVAAVLVVIVSLPARAEQPIEIGSRLELMVDSHLIDRMSGGTALRMHRPTPGEVAIVLDSRGRAAPASTSRLCKTVRCTGCITAAAT